MTAATEAQEPSHTRVAIVGTGIAGVGAAVALKQAGMHDFVTAPTCAERPRPTASDPTSGATCAEPTVAPLA